MRPLAMRAGEQVVSAVVGQVPFFPTFSTGWLTCAVFFGMAKPTAVSAFNNIGDKPIYFVLATSYFNSGRAGRSKKSYEVEWDMGPSWVF